MLKTIKYSDMLALDLYTFYKFVEPFSVTDLKHRALYMALGLGSDSGYNFSLWSRGWEDNMRVDYLGNYMFGYNGATYWHDFDFDKSIKEPISFSSFIGKALPAPYNNPFSNVGALLIKSTIDVARAANPDKTDGEILSLLGGGGAQLIDDVDEGMDLIEAIQKYISSIKDGHWGDNPEDSRFAIDGIHDYHATREN